MGGLDGEGGIGVDSAVGTIVWVRRRNGSWWPGRILGSEELSASHLMSPRSGTPVKLLGREDASVDWYNLEKSKRVKAFRCGEFDACIERAEASQGIPIKKREKYARREDAILHALELEKQLEMKHQNFKRVANGIKNRNSNARRREMNRFSSDIHMRDDESGVHSKLTCKKSHMFSKKAVSSCKEEYTGWEEEHPENISQVGGLQDFGLRIASSKRKLSQPVTWEASRKSLNVNVDVLSNARHMAGNESHTSSSRSSLATKRKKSHGDHGEDSVSKKSDRWQPLAQVFQSSSNLSVSHSFQSDYDTGSISIQGERDRMGAAYLAKKSRCVYPPAYSNDSLDNNRYPYDEMTSPSTQFGTENSGPLTDGYSSSSELAEETESDSSETDYLEPDTEEDGNIMADADQEEAPGFEDYNPPLAQVSENYRDPNNDEIPLPGYIPTVHLQDHLDASVDAGVSKWNLKGKRKIRNLAKRPVEKIFNNNMTEMVSSSQRSARVGFYHENDIFENDLGHGQLLGYGHRRYPCASHGFNDSDIDSHLLSPPSHMGRRAYWEESDEPFNLDFAGYYGDEMESLLVDVNIKVQNPSHQGEHVPLVSLMSRFNGKQIIGHPVQIEILEDGSSVHLVSKFDTGLDQSSASPSFGRTAKRSTMHRLPRSNPSSSVVEDDDRDLFDSDQEIRTPVGYSNHQARFPRKNISNSRRPKILQRVNSSSTQKTRSLSSFATEQSRGLKLHRRSSIIDGLIKPDAGIPLVTCVPVKVVFSRILESIGRPSSISAHRVRGPS